VAHQNVTANGKEAQRGGSESMVGGVGQIDYHAFDGFDYVALGHIHAAFPVGRPTVRYAGSPLCYHFDELRQRAKGPLLVELGAKGTEPVVTLLPVEPLHRLRALEGPYEQIRAELAAASHENEYLSVTLTDRRVTPELAESLRSLCETQRILLMELSSVWQEVRSEAGLNAASLRERGLTELFTDFYASRSGGAEPNEAELSLLRKAAALAERADCRTEPEPQQFDALIPLVGRVAVHFPLHQPETHVIDIRRGFRVDFNALFLSVNRVFHCNLILLYELQKFVQRNGNSPHIDGLMAVSDRCVVNFLIPVADHRFFRLALQFVGKNTEGVIFRLRFIDEQKRCGPGDQVCPVADFFIIGVIGNAQSPDGFVVERSVITPPKFRSGFSIIIVPYFHKLTGRIRRADDKRFAPRL
jgi:hypothetical protein